MRSIISGVKAVITAEICTRILNLFCMDNVLKEIQSGKVGTRDFLEAREWELLYQSNRSESGCVVHHHVPGDGSEVEHPILNCCFQNV